MDFLRIGEKLVSYSKIENLIKQILSLRSRGYSQKEVSNRLLVDRTFISRIENIGEVHKGRKIAVLGFPLQNKEELQELCREYGVEYSFFMSEYERRAWLRNKSGEEMLNQIMELAHEIRAYDIVIVLGSNYRINLIKALINKEIIGVQIGESPIEEDVYVAPKRLSQIFDHLVTHN